MRALFVIVPTLLFVSCCNTTQYEAESVAIEGRIIQKPWSKTEESWRAGGSEYYVLDVGNAHVHVRSAAEGVILKPTDTVSMDAIAGSTGQRVRVHGHYVPDEPYTPENDFEQYPVDANGDPLPRGGGFAVRRIESL